MRPSVLSMLVLGLSIPAIAQVPDNMDLELAALLNTPIQGASKREQRLIDSPQAAEVLTGNEIRQMGIYRLADALKLMTSVDVLEMDTQATYVTIRGAMQQGTPRTVQILIDGVPLYNGETGSVDVDNIPVPVDLIDKVEVVRGPSSSLYGANAVAGVISITTRKPTASTTGGLRASRATNNTTRGAADLTTSFGKLGLTAGYSGASIGVDRESTKNLGTGTTSELDQNSAHQHSGFARAQFDFSEKGRIWASAGEAKKHYGVSSSNSIPYGETTTQTLQGGWSQDWSPRFRTEARVSRMEQEQMWGPSPDFPASSNDSALNGDYTWMDFTSTLLELQGNWDVTDSFHLVGGGDRRTSTAGKASFLGLNNSQDVTASGAFLNLDWNILPVLTLSMGARAENETLGGSRTSPRAALVWNPTSSSSLRAGYYSSSRSPQVLEKDNAMSVSVGSLGNGMNGVFESLPNASLNPEKVTSVEVGYRQQVSKVTLDVTAFKMKFSGLIAQSTTNVAASNNLILENQYTNNGGSLDQGLELAAQWLVSSRLSVGGNFTWLDYTLDGSSRQLDYAPKTKVNLWTRYNNGPFSAYAAFQHVASVNISISGAIAATQLETKRPATDQLNLNLGWQFRNGLSLGTYARNACKQVTQQGASGPISSYSGYLYQGARREIGGTVAYRF